MTFNLLEINSNKYRFIIVSTSFKSPLHCLETISNELVNRNCNECMLIFDMLLNMGNTSERFIEARFDGKNIDQASLNYVLVGKKDELRRITANHLLINPSFFDVSVLNSYQINMLSKGITI